MDVKITEWTSLDQQHRIFGGNQTKARLSEEGGSIKSKKYEDNIRDDSPCHLAT